MSSKFCKFIWSYFKFDLCKFRNLFYNFFVKVCGSQFANAVTSGDYNGDVKFKVSQDGRVTAAGVIETTGQNTVNSPSTLKISQENANVSQIRAYGRDDSTVGSLEFRISAGDGAPSYIPLTLNNDGSITAVGGKCGFTSEGELFFSSRNDRFRLVVQGELCVAEPYTREMELKEKAEKYFQGGVTMDIDNSSLNQD